MVTIGTDQVKLKELSSIPRTRRVKGKNRFPQADFLIYVIMYVSSTVYQLHDDIDKEINK